MLDKILGIIFMIIMLSLGYNEFVRPLFKGLSIKERIQMILQGIIGAACMYSFAVIMIVLAPSNM